MADFVQQSITKFATRVLTNPIADVDSLEPLFTVRLLDLRATVGTAHLSTSGLVMNIVIDS